MSYLEILGTILGLGGVALMIRRNLWAFPVSLLQVVIFGWVCYEQRLYSETVLQAIFFVALAYGWWRWTHPGANRIELPVQKMTALQRGCWAAATLVLWLGWGGLMAGKTDAALPYGDGFVFAVSVASQWLQARKIIENWIGWIAANTAAIAVFLLKDLLLFAALYAVFWVMAWWGWREWHRASAPRPGSSPT
jgi:nicotinamide mononucleotide transporter